MGSSDSCKIDPSFPTSSSFDVILRAFALEQRTLALDAPTVAGKRTVVAHDPVTRDRDRDRIRCAGLRNRTNGLRRTDARRDLCVAHGGTHWDLTQRLPDSLLKRSPAHVERQVQTDRGRLYEPDDFSHQGLELSISANQLRIPKAI